MSASDPKRRGRRRFLALATSTIKEIRWRHLGRALAWLQRCASPFSATFLLAVIEAFLIVIPPSSPRCRPFGAALAIYVIRSASGVHEPQQLKQLAPLGRTFIHRQSIANTMASDILIVDDEADI